MSKKRNANIAASLALGLLAASASTRVDAPDRVFSKRRYGKEDHDRALVRAENRKKNKAARRAKKRNRK